MWNISLASLGHCPGCAPLQLPVQLLAGRAETQRRPRKHHLPDGWIVAANVILTLNPKPSTVLATERKINSIPSKTRTVSEAPAHGQEEVPLWEQRTLGFPSLDATTVEEA